MTRDPICMAEVDVAGAERHGLKSDYNAQTFYFCSPECKERFDRDPGAFMVDWESTDDEPADGNYSI